MVGIDEPLQKILLKVIDQECEVCWVRDANDTDEAMQVKSVCAIRELREYLKIEHPC